MSELILRLDFITHTFEQNLTVSTNYRKRTVINKTARNKNVVFIFQKRKQCLGSFSGKAVMLIHSADPQ